MVFMKKTMYIPYKTILITLFFTISGTTAALCETPPSPAGLEEPPALEIDLYLIPMIIVGTIFSFFVIRKNTRP